MSLETLRARLNYHGGNQDGRMNQDKLRGLRKALWYSYQDTTAILADGREFRCLMNPDKDAYDYNDFIISIPYEDICLNADQIGKTSQGMQKIGMKPGDVFTWKETNTKWLVYLEHISEDAYFRADVRKCDQEVEVNGQKYWVYLRGPTETSIQWNQKAGVEWNDLNYSLVMFITKDVNTLDFFHRFKTIKIEDDLGVKQTWQVATVNPYYADGIIKVCLNEHFNNDIADAAEQERREKEAAKPALPKSAPYIEGPTAVSAYSVATYTIHNIDGGKWCIEDNGDRYFVFKDRENLSDPNSITIDINKRKGILNIIYAVNGIDITLPITVQGF